MDEFVSLVVFHDQMFALTADGKLYRINVDEWGRCEVVCAIKSIKNLDQWAP